MFLFRCRWRDLRPGWAGQVEPGAEKAGQTINDTKLPGKGTLHVTTGPAAAFWNPRQGNGNYTVSATFTEPKYMNLNSHPHPTAFHRGDDMGTDQNSELYSAYGDGRFIVRGFGPEPFK